MEIRTSTPVCLFILTLAVGILSSSIPAVQNQLSDANSEENPDQRVENKLTEDGGKREMLGTFIQVDKSSEVKGRQTSGHVGAVPPAIPFTVMGNNDHTSQVTEYAKQNGYQPLKPYQLSDFENDFKLGKSEDQFQPSDSDFSPTLQEPPRTGRDYPVSSDNYGWTYPSSSGASTAAGSASYYPSAEYGKPSPAVDNKLYSWAAPSAEDKYKRPYYTYTVNQGGVPVECIPIPMAGIITEMTKGGTGGGGNKLNSIIRGALSALVALFVIKIPILIALKALVFKFFVIPATFFMISLPVLTPILYFFLPSFMKDKDKTTTAKPATMVMMMSNPNQTRANRGLYEDTLGGRKARTLFHEDGSVTEDFEQLMKSLIGEQNCVEKMACQFGVRDAQSQYRKPISWVLKYVQSMGPVLSDLTLRVKLKMYREAYNFGADIAASNGTADARNAEVVCSDTLYPCQKPQVIVKQARTIYKLV